MRLGITAAAGPAHHWLSALGLSVRVLAPVLRRLLQKLRERRHVAPQRRLRGLPRTLTTCTSVHDYDECRPDSKPVWLMCQVGVQHRCRCGGEALQVILIRMDTGVATDEKPLSSRTACANMHRKTS